MNMKLSNIKRLEIPASIIFETEQFCSERGKKGFEAKLYWIGVSISETDALITRVFIPKQIARKSLFGVSVEVPEEGNLELISNLGHDEIALVKLHTHPMEAYLSNTDLSNPFFRHEGAISVVIPNFCRKSLSQLTHCCINVFQEGEWLEMNKKQIEDMFIIRSKTYGR